MKPDTLIRWHRKGFRLFWRWKSRPKGRPPVPEELRKLIYEMATSNVTWGEERIAHELLVKLGIRVSPRTVRKYMPTQDDSDRGARHSSQRWATFVRNHAKAVVAADFLTVHGLVQNFFRVGRHLLRAPNHRELRGRAFLATR